MVIARAGSTISVEDLKAYCLAKGPAYSHPRFIDIVGALPLNGAGKIDRGAVAAKLNAAYGIERSADVPLERGK
jgi:acyl-CoA synthetase (AMP-forming)/AMP-acid ligase II